MGVIMNKLRKIISKMFLGKSRNLNDYKEIDYETLKHYAKTDKNVVIVDVRSPQEYAEKRLPLAINIPLYELESKMNQLLNKDAKIILYCQSGIRSKRAEEILIQNGYTDVCSLKDGLDGI